MKKKLFLIIAAVAVFTCLFAISITAGETTGVHSGKVDLDATVTIDEQELALFDADGNALIWFYGPDSALTSIRADIGISGENKVDFQCNSWASTINGAMAHQVDKLIITYNGVEYPSNSIVVFNILDDDVFVTTSKQNNAPVGSTVNCITSLFKDSTNIQYAYLRLDTVAIQGNSFYNAEKLKYVNLADLTELNQISGGSSFRNCISLFAGQNLDLSKTKVKVIGGDGCFAKVPFTGVVFPNTLTTIGSWNFQETGLTSVTIPASVTKIEGSATFKGCTSLKTVDMSAISLGSINSSMFENCSVLETVYMPSGYTSIGDNAFKSCTALTGFDGESKIILPSTCTSLAKSPFSGCTSLSYADLGQITSMNYDAFANCTSLTEVVIPGTLQSIGARAFQGTGLIYVSLPNSVTTMDYGVFMNCKSLQYVELSNAIAVRDQIFSGCTSLKAVSIPEGVTTVESRAFNGCTSLKAVYLPTTITTIGTNTGWGCGAFNGCTNLYFVQKPFNVKDENGKWLGEYFVMPTEPEVYYMPSSLSTLYGGEFQGCQQINEFVVFPVALSSISYDSGPFVNTGSSNSKGGVTYVFLGPMDTMKYNPQDNRYKNITFVFANEKNTGIETLAWVLTDTRQSSNFYAYFCAGQVSYDLGSFAPSSSGYTVKEGDFTKTTYTEENQPHFVDPNKTIVTDPTCTIEGNTTTYCFCGDDIEVTPIDALGHDYTLKADGAAPEVYAWFYVDNNFFGNATEQYKCLDCEALYDLGKEVANTSLFVAGGYSIPEQGTTDCISHTIMINKTNIDLYAQHTIDGAKINYGTVAAAGSALGTPIEVDDEGNVTPKLGALIADMTGTDYVKLVIKISGVPADTAVNCNAYVVVGKEIYYVCDDEVTTVAKEQKLGLTA